MPSQPTVRLPIHDPHSSGRDVTDEVREEESRDLVFGLVGYLGAGATWVAGRLTSVLRAAQFQPHTIKLSELIEQHAPSIKSGRSKVDRTRDLQDSGDRLRESGGHSFVAAMAVREIRHRRDTNRGERAFIIDQLKHPKEVELLRAIYGHSFYLISVVCSESTRRSRLQLKYFKDAEATDRLEELVDRDRLDSLEHGQRVHKTFHLGDLFVVNEGTPGSAEQDSLFAGVAPRRFARLFEKRSELKKDGYYQPPDRREGHADPVLKKSFLDLEEKIATEVQRKLAEQGA